MKSNQNGNPDIELELNYLIQKRREIDKYLDVRDTELTHDDRVHVIFRLSQMSKSSNNFTFEEHSIQNKITDTMVGAHFRLLAPLTRANPHLPHFSPHSLLRGRLRDLTPYSY